MKRHAKASSAGSTQRRGRSLGRYFRGAFATRVFPLCSQGSGAPSYGGIRFALAPIAAFLILLAFSPAALAAQTPGGTPTATFGPDGTSGTSFGTNSPEQLAFNEASHRLYVFNRGGPNVYAFNSPGLSGAIAGFPLAVAAPGPDVGLYRADIAVDNTVSPSPTAGNLYYVSLNQHKIYAFNSAGSALGGNFPIEPLGLPPGGYYAGSGYKEICSAGVDSAGNLYVGDEANGFYGNDGVIRKYSPSGAPLGLLNTPEPAKACDIAFDSNDDMFVSGQTGFGGGAWMYTAASGYDPGSATKLPFSEGSTAVAVDASRQEVYVARRTKVSTYTTGGSFISDFATGIAGENLGGIAVDQANGKVYVADNGNHKVYAFGFINIADTAAGNATPSATSAILRGQVNPNGLAVSDCHFEYTTEDEYQVNGFVNSTHVPCGANPGSGSRSVAVGAGITGLTPGAEYRFRLVAADANGVSTSTSAFFATLGPQVHGEEATQISSTAAKLTAQVDPNGEATSYRFEYVSQAEFEQSGFANASLLPSVPVGIGSGNADVAVSQTLSGLAPGATYHFRAVASNSAATANGHGSALTTLAYDNASSCPNPLFHTGIAANLPDCRAYEQVSPLEKSGFDVAPGGGLASPEGAILYWSNGAFADPHSGAFPNQYLGRFDGGSWLTASDHPVWNPIAAANFGPQIFALSGDLTKQLVTTNAKLGTEGVEEEGAFNIYLHDSVDGSYRYVSTGYGENWDALTEETRPEGADLQGNTFLFNVGVALDGSSPPAPSSGGLYEFNASSGELNYIGNMSGAGDKAFQGPVALHPVSDNGQRVYATSQSTSALYLREGGQSTLVSERQSDHSAKGATFWGASSNGSLAYFTSGQRLTSDASPNPFGGAEDLYRYDNDAVGSKLTDLTPDQADPSGADVRNVLGMSHDGSYVYFTASGVLAPGARSGICGEGGIACNIYVWHDGVTRYIGSTSRLLFSEQGFYSVPNNVWRVSGNGRYLAIVTKQQIVGPHLQPTQPFGQAYLYDYQADALACVSCVASVTPSSGVSFDENDAYGTGYFFSNLSYFAGLTRNVSEAGQVFFESSDPLVPQDTNGRRDVYEYESGHLRLISSGQNNDDSFFEDATPSGNDVFFTTREQLVGADTDPLVDLYDARVGGGLAAQLAGAQGAVCQGDACHGQPSSPAAGQGPGTPQFEGPGNPKTGHGESRKHRKHRKHRKQHRHHRNAKHNRRASR